MQAKLTARPGPQNSSVVPPPVLMTGKVSPPTTHPAVATPAQKRENTADTSQPHAVAVIDTAATERACIERVLSPLSRSHAIAPTR